MHINQIDTRHGTANQHSFSHGNCLPYTGVPFGMNYFAPQTNEQGSWWFHPDDRVFQGYRLTHQPSPWMSDFSHLLVTPVSGEFPTLDFQHIQSSYRPEESIFSPTQLTIRQLHYGITSTLTPSMYGASLSLSYATQKENGLVFFLPGRYRLEQIDPYTIKGHVINFSGCEDPDFTFYFVCSFEYPLTSDSLVLSGEDGFCHVQFKETNEQHVHLATSFISHEQAFYHLAQEKDQKPADYLTASQKDWQQYFDRIEIEHQDQEQVRTFYHNLYRVFLFPQTFYEVTPIGEKIHYDTYSKHVRPGVLYTNNGFWDTYKTVYPLYSLIAKEKYEEMLEGFLNSYRETGFLPKWLSPDERGLMPGTLIDAVIADAAIKGIRNDLMPEFLDAMIKGATVQSKDPNYGRQGTIDYLTYGYVPSDYHESVNHTLDYAYSDFCIYQTATVLEKKEIAATYHSRALNYRNIFDSTTGFMRAKDREGAFRSDFSSIRWGKDYAEGSAWQSSFAVYQDFQGLIEQYGGQEAFLEKLVHLCNQPPLFDSTGYGFEIHEMSEMAAIEFGQLAISNQPSFHYPYLFSYAGHPEMAQPLIKQLLTQTFDATKNGYPGDEDNGSMAGWYIFNSLGFYPVSPGTGEYVIGLPLFDKVVVHLSSGEDLTLTTSPNKPQQQFIHEVQRNGRRHQPLFFTHDDLQKGGTIHYHLGIVPSLRNYEKEEYPYSMTK